MGNYYSTHIILHQWKNPQIETKYERFPIRLVLDGLDGPDASQVTLRLANEKTALQDKLLFKSIFKQLQPGQRIILLKSSLFYIHNELPKDIELHIDNIFPPDAIPVPNEQSVHPDFTRRLLLYFPSSMSGQPSQSDAILYRPHTLKEETILNYAGLEDAILKPRASLLPPLSGDPVDGGLEVFEQGDPLIEFIFTHQDALKMEKGAMEKITKANKDYYRVSRQILDDVRNIFKFVIYQDLRYTRFEDTKINTSLPRGLQEELYARYKGTPPGAGPTLFFVMDMSFILITPGDQRLNHSELVLK